MRSAFINQLTEEAKKDNKIFLLVGDLGFSVVEKFAEMFPDRFLNTGISEQNMAGIAAGLAFEGYTVFIYSIANFPTLRCMEQIRYDLAYHNLNVKIVAVGAGYSYGPLGVSHHATEEMGMLRIIPNMTVCSPGDPSEARAVTTFAAKSTGLCYIRLGKAGEKKVHDSWDLLLSAGDILPVREINDSETVVFATGSILKYCFDFLLQNELNASLYSFPFIKPINTAALKRIIIRYRKIITVEEHQMSGGFGSAILEIINDLMDSGELKTHPRIKRIAIPDKFYSVAGSQDYLRKLSGISLNISDF